VAATGALGEKNEGELNGHWRSLKVVMIKIQEVDDPTSLYMKSSRMPARCHDLSDSTVSDHEPTPGQGPTVSTALLP